MSTSDLETLRSIKTFPSLVRYLRDELDWPIDSEDFDDLTFDWEPEELGIDPANAAKIETIKQLRPPPTGFPWGIFFVKFEPKRLPVVALRRILSQLVIKKRASIRKADQPSWHLNDLLFISNYGEGDLRQITFAQFSQNEVTGELPTLKVLGWDDADTVLHIDHVHQELNEKLRWPDDETDVKGWQERWSSAFVLRHREVVTTSKDLAIRLAGLATRIRNRANQVLAIETEHGPFRKLHRAFQTALIHDLSADDFADMYAQTITYGLLSSRIADPKSKTADDFAAHMRTNPFLRELMQTFLKIGGRRGRAGGPGIDFDELGVSEVVELLDDANMEAVVRDFGDRNPQEDPVTHFYEGFAKEYDPIDKVRRGEFYTPRPVVSYIVRSVDELLRTEFGLADGLADTTTWGEMANRHKGLQIPEGLSPDQAFVQILDPATGTGTFIVEAIDLIYRTLTTKWKAQGHSASKIETLWNEYVPKHLLTRLHAYELKMAPYAIAHLKVGLKLYETGYRFGSDERARIYLTNALEPASSSADAKAAGLFEALGHEARAVNGIKRRQRFTVVIGNPPYSVTSSNFNSYIDSLMDDYKKHVRGEQGLVALADDYLKFIRLSQEILRTSNCGIWGMITNHGYLKGVIHRGVRKELLSQFNSMYVLDLHGDSNIGERVPTGKSNENVFDIQQGVSISIAARNPINQIEGTVKHGDSWGNRNEKYGDLSLRPISHREWAVLRPTPPRFFLIPFDDTNLAEYQAWPSVDDLMPVNSCGVKTHRDALVIDYDKEVLISRISDVASERRLELLREQYGIFDTPHWKLRDAQAKMKPGEVPSFVHRLTYRPFDYRWIYYNPMIIEKGDSKYPTLRHMLKDNLALLTARIQATGVFDAVFISRYLVEMKTAESSRSCTVFPLYLAAHKDYPQGELAANIRRANFNPQVLHSLAERLDLKLKGDSGLPQGLTPEDIFHYAYAVFHSPGYRSRYAEFLKIEFPRLPLTGSLDLFRTLARLGGELVALHLMESPKLDKHMTKVIGKGSPEVEKVAYSDKTVWIDKAQTQGFRGVPENVWDFHIGGYQVCEKWLKDRKGRTLSVDDITHYNRIVVALNETICLMPEIDKVIDAHGGWPGAFVTSKDVTVTKDPSHPLE